MPSTSLSTVVEDIITDSFYKSNRSHRRALAYNYGLQSPLWFWGLSVSGDAKVFQEKEVQRLTNLTRWMLQNKRGSGSIALVVAPAWQKKVEEEIKKMRKELGAVPSGETADSQGTPNAVTGPSATTDSDSLQVELSVLPHHELTVRMQKMKAHVPFDVVVYSVGITPSVETLKTFIAHEEWIRDAAFASSCSFIMSCEIGWTAPAVRVKWLQWKLFVEKMEAERLPISTQEDAALTYPTSNVDSLPQLMGRAIPLCCSAHPNQRQMEYGMSPIHSECERMCLESLPCRQRNHICRERCHCPAFHQGLCFYRCNAILECGHPCLLACSSPCNCFEVVEHPLQCHHEIPLGLDKENGETIYARVNHFFRGYCTHSARPCQAEFETECAKCWGPMTVMCFEATEMSHTLANKTLICDSCQRLSREIRAEILGEILLETEQSRKRLRVELTRTVHQQHKAAQQSIFLPGERVEIVDSTRCVAPLLEDDFPNIEFCNIDDNDFFTRMQGAYGTFVSSHVDTIDVTEMRHLVRLPNGNHVLVTDGGLRLIRASVDKALQTATLLLTAGPGGVSSEGFVGSAPEIKKMIGKTFYLALPAFYTFEREEKKISDCFVTVVREDPNDKENVVVETYAYNTDNAAELGSTNINPFNSSGNIARTKLPDSLLVKYTFTFPARIESLEALDGFIAGKQVYLAGRDHQVRDTVLLNLIAEIARFETKDDSITLSAVRMQEDTPYTVICLMNSPPAMDIGSRSLGPIALVRGSSPSMPTNVKSRRSHRCARRREEDFGSNRRGGSQGPIYAVPYMFLRPDEQGEGEAKLDATAQETYRKKVEEALEKRFEDLAYRNDEKNFYKLEQLPPVTPAMKEVERRVYSTPFPIATEREIAEIKKKFVEMPIASDARTRMLSLQDNISQKKEKGKLAGVWVKEVGPRIEMDLSADSAHIRAAQVRLMQR